MGLAAVPFGTAQAEDYKLQAHAGVEVCTLAHVSVSR